MKKKTYVWLKTEIKNVGDITYFYKEVDKT